ncbi:MAG: AMP-binding protein [Alkalispirochaeta sp.]
MANKKTIRDVLIHSLTEYADLEANGVVEGASWRYRDIGTAVSALFRLFRERGIAAGDRIALLSENQPAWTTVYLSVVSYGAIVVPILPDFTGEDVVSILEHSGAKLLFLSSKQEEKVSTRVAAGAVVPETIVIDKLVEGYTAESDDADVAAVRTEIESVPPPGPDDTAAIIYTSGTTGHSKGVELSHWNIVSNVESADHFANIKPGDRLLSILPLAHTYECTLGMLIPFSRGAQVTYLGRQASPSFLMKALASVRPQLMLSVPLLIEKIVRGKIIPQLAKGPVKVLKQIPILRGLIYRKAGKKLVDAFGGRLRFFGIGGAPLSVDVETVLNRMKFPYAIGYGLTETAPLLAGTSPTTNVLRSTGVATPGVELRIQDGEIQARGPNVMKGYYLDPERTAEVFTEDGWFRTGDLGEFDESGNLFVKGRSKTMILGSSGENIYPEAIESIINQFIGVEESLVVQEGSKLVARVKVDYEHLSDAARNMAGSAVRRAGQAAEAAADAAGVAADHAKSFLDDLRKRVNERLSGFSRITEIREQDEPFVKTPTSKIKRYLYQRGNGEKTEDGEKTQDGEKTEDGENDQNRNDVDRSGGADDPGK